VAAIFSAMFIVATPTVTHDYTAEYRGLILYLKRRAAFDDALASPRGSHAAPLHSCKYRWLHAPATISTRSERSPVLGDLFAFWAAPSIAARFPFSSILSSPSVGVRMTASMSPRSASVASVRVSGCSRAWASVVTLWRYSSAISG